MLTREKIEETLKILPNEFSIDDLIDKIILTQKIEEGLLQSENGQILSSDQAKQKLDKWLK
jgi:hypothetical protein